MKIGLDGRPLKEKIHSCGIYTYYLTTYLLKHGVECVLFYDEEPKFKIKGAKIVVAETTMKRREYWEQIVLPKYLSHCGLDLYHATNNYGIPLVNKTLPCVVTLHDVIPLALPGFFTKARTKNLAKAWFWFYSYLSLVRSDHIIINSQSAWDDMNNFFPKINQQKVTMVYQGLNFVQQSTKKVAMARNKWGLVNKKYIINFGGLDERKNLRGLLEAMTRVVKSYPEAILLITGENKRLEPVLKQKISGSGIDKNVVLSGWVSESDKWALLQGAVASIYPSFYEGFGFPPLESMAAGVPVITTKAGSIPEICRKIPFYANPYDINEMVAKIKELLHFDTIKYGKRIKNGIKQAEKYSWDKFGDEIMDVYRKILRQKI